MSILEEIAGQTPKQFFAQLFDLAVKEGTLIQDNGIWRSYRLVKKSARLTASTYVMSNTQDLTFFYAENGVEHVLSMTNDPNGRLVMSLS